MAAKQGSTTTKQLPAAAGHFDPKFDWIDNAASYVLRLHLQGFKKDDFRVQVDGAGRLTVRGQHADANHAQPRCFHKVFQLPPAASLDDISGRFEAGVLTITVPKHAAASAAAPTTIEELKKPKPPVKEEGAAAAPNPPPKDQVDGTAKQRKEDAAEKEAAPAAGKLMEEITKDADVKKKAMDEPAGKVPELQHKTETKRRQQEENQPKAAIEKQSKPDDEKAKAIEHGILPERVRQRAEEAAVDEAGRETKTWCGGWKERVAGELEDLVYMKWTDGLVEMARNNKELVAATIAAFSLGFFVSQKLFSRK